MQTKVVQSLTPKSAANSKPNGPFSRYASWAAQGLNEELGAAASRHICSSLPIGLSCCLAAWILWGRFGFLLAALIACLLGIYLLRARIAVAAFRDIQFWRPDEGLRPLIAWTLPFIFISVLACYLLPRSNAVDTGAYFWARFTVTSADSVFVPTQPSELTTAPATHHTDHRGF